LKHDDMNVSINTVIKYICRAGNATCMKRSMQDDVNGPEDSMYGTTTVKFTARLVLLFISLSSCRL
jgi:hypothetical protein